MRNLRWIGLLMMLPLSLACSEVVEITLEDTGEEGVSVPGIMFKITENGKDGYRAIVMNPYGEPCSMEINFFPWKDPYSTVFIRCEENDYCRTFEADREENPTLKSTKNAWELSESENSRGIYLFPCGEQQYAASDIHGSGPWGPKGWNIEGTIKLKPGESLPR